MAIETSVPAEVLSDCMAAMANQVMKHMYELCGPRLDLMLSVSNLINHRCEMLYRTGYIRNYDDALKEQQESKAKREANK